MAFPNNLARKPYVAVPIPSHFIPAKNEGKQQILWIGCSDSLILETECLEGLREEMFVYRNLGGLVVNGDLSTQSAIEWGIGLLKVDHVVVCGHYGCKVVCGKTTEWSRPISQLRSLTDAHPTFPIEDDSDATDLEKKIAKERRFEEEYVLAEVEWLKQQEIVMRAIEERGLQVHAFVYDKEKNTNWRLVDDEGKSMEIGTANTEDAEAEN